ncbi:MAG: penicillin-binding protein [Hyphococcus sp.]|nr:MAG: penicillin-binding protein [Marinicaulis sp.]
MHILKSMAGMSVAALVVFGCGQPDERSAVREPQTVADENNAYLAAILDDRIFRAERNIGMAAAVILPDGAQIYTAGERIAGGGASITPDTIFEIGSLTKIFTSVILADMVAKGEVSLNDPISKYLPTEVSLQNSLGDRITLLHLATHTSGFERNPPNSNARDERGIFANYGKDKLFEYLRNVTPESAPGEIYAYSNIGMGLLGYILAERASVTYAELIKERVFDPLGMVDTHLVTPTAMDDRFAEPHNSIRKPSSRWDFDILAGAGAIRSTLNDMQKFAASFAGFGADVDITTSIKSTYEQQYAIPGGDKSFYLGWISPTQTASGENIFWHDGGTGGSRSFFGFINNADRKQAVVILSNTAFSVNDIGLHLLDEERPLRELESLREIELPVGALAPFPGVYQLGEDETMTISEENGQLYAQVSNDKRYPVYPYKVNAFFYTVADAQIIFDIDDTGSVVSLILVVEGHKRVAKKL